MGNVRSLCSNVDLKRTCYTLSKPKTADDYDLYSLLEIESKRHDDEATKSDTSMLSALQVLQKASSAKGVLVTAGELGCSYAFRKLEGSDYHSGYLPVLSVTVEDTTGAGDAFLSGFLYAMLQVDASKIQIPFSFPRVNLNVPVISAELFKPTR